MKKSLLALFLVLIMLSFSSCAWQKAPTAFKLVPVTVLKEGTEYVLTHNSTIDIDPITVTREWLDKMGMTLEDAAQFGKVCLNTDITSIPYQFDAEQLSNISVLSVSPDGKTILAGSFGTLLIIRGNQIRIVSLDLTRCEPSENDGYEYALRMYRRADNIGTAGIIWSKDGRYALVNNAMYSGQMAESIFGLTWIDTFDGTIYMAQSGGHGLDEATFVVNACPDSDGKSIYMNILERVDGLISGRLRKYTPGEAAYEEQATLMDYNIGCEGMGFDEAGNIVFTEYNRSQGYGIVRYSPKTRTFTRESLPRYVTPLYMSVTPACTIMTSYYGYTKDGKPAYLPPILQRDGKLYWLIVENDAARLEAIEDYYDRPQQTAGLTIVQVALTSDGKEALLACRDSENAYHVYLMNTKTLALTSVDISAIEAEADDRLPLFECGYPLFRPGMIFTGGDRYVIVPFYGGSSMLFELKEERIKENNPA